MSAEILRRAAALMRERADAAGFTAPSPWLVDGAEITTDDQEPIEPLCVATSGIHWQEAHAVRSHVASWHPDVALAVAELLDSVARAERHEVNGADIHNALTVARTYLGEQQ